MGLGHASTRSGLERRVAKACGSTLKSSAAHACRRDLATVRMRSRRKRIMRELRRAEDALLCDEEEPSVLYDPGIPLLRPVARSETRGSSHDDPQGGSGPGTLRSRPEARQQHQGPRAVLLTTADINRICQVQNDEDAGAGIPPGRRALREVGPRGAADVRSSDELGPGARAGRNAGPMDDRRVGGDPVGSTGAQRRRGDDMDVSGRSASRDDSGMASTGVGSGLRDSTGVGPLDESGARRPSRTAQTDEERFWIECLLGRAFGGAAGGERHGDTSRDEQAVRGGATDAGRGDGAVSALAGDVGRVCRALEAAAERLSTAAGRMAEAGADAMRAAPIDPTPDREDASETQAGREGGRRRRGSSGEEGRGAADVPAWEWRDLVPEAFEDAMAAQMERAEAALRRIRAMEADIQESDVEEANGAPWGRWGQPDPRGDAMRSASEFSERGGAGRHRNAEQRGSRGGHAGLRAGFVGGPVGLRAGHRRGVGEAVGDLVGIELLPDNGLGGGGGALRLRGGGYEETEEEEEDEEGMEGWRGQSEGDAGGDSTEGEDWPIAELQGAAWVATRLGGGEKARRGEAAEIEGLSGDEEARGGTGGETGGEGPSVHDGIGRGGGEEEARRRAEDLVAAYDREREEGSTRAVTAREKTRERGPVARRVGAGRGEGWEEVEGEGGSWPALAGPSMLPRGPGSSVAAVESLGASQSLESAAWAAGHKAGGEDGLRYAPRVAEGRGGNGEGAAATGGGEPVAGGALGGRAGRPGGDVHGARLVAERERGEWVGVYPRVARPEEMLRRRGDHSGPARLTRGGRKDPFVRLLEWATLRRTQFAVVCGRGPLAPEKVALAAERMLPDASVGELTYVLVIAEAASSLWGSGARGGLMPCDLRAAIVQQAWMGRECRRGGLRVARAWGRAAMEEIGARELARLFAGGVRGARGLPSVLAAMSDALPPPDRPGEPHIHAALAAMAFHAGALAEAGRVTVDGLVAALAPPPRVTGPMSDPADAGLEVFAGRRASRGVTSTRSSPGGLPGAGQPSKSSNREAPGSSRRAAGSCRSPSPDRCDGSLSFATQHSYRRSASGGSHRGQGSTASGADEGSSGTGKGYDDDAFHGLPDAVRTAIRAYFGADGGRARPPGGPEADLGSARETVVVVVNRVARAGKSSGESTDEDTSSSGTTRGDGDGTSSGGERAGSASASSFSSSYSSFSSQSRRGDATAESREATPEGPAANATEPQLAAGHDHAAAAPRDASLTMRGEEVPRDGWVHLLPDGFLPEEVGAVIRVRGGADAVLKAVSGRRCVPRGVFGGFDPDELGDALERQARRAQRRLARRKAGPPPVLPEELVGRVVAAMPARKQRNSGAPGDEAGGAGGGAGGGARGEAMDHRVLEALRREKAAREELAAAQQRARDAAKAVAEVQLARIGRDVDDVSRLAQKVEDETAHSKR